MDNLGPLAIIGRVGSLWPEISFTENLDKQTETEFRAALWKFDNNQMRHILQSCYTIISHNHCKYEKLRMELSIPPTTWPPWTNTYVVSLSHCYFFADKN